MNDNSEPKSQKVYLSAGSLFVDACNLAAQVVQSGFKPDFLVALWRGGTPVGICMQEILAYFGIETDHIAIRTSLYKGIDRRAENIRIHGLGYLIDRANVDDSLLIVDDIYDTGTTIDALISAINRRARRNTPNDIRIAAAWYKPNRRLTDREPDYFAHTTDDWVVFPHELMVLEYEEIMENKPEIASVIESVRRTVQVPSAC